MFFECSDSLDALKSITLKLMQLFNKSPHNSFVGVVPGKF